MAGISGYIIGGAIALVVAVFGGTIVQLIKRLYIDEIKDTQSAAQNLTAFFIFVFTSVALGALFCQPFGVVLAVGLGLTFGVATARYWLILNCYGDSGASADKHAIFATFKERLAEGGLGVKRYEQYLGWALDRVDRFFGDADPAVKTLWPGAFGFKGAKPFWTAPAYSRCLSVGLLYPILVLFVVWGISGNVGPGEAALMIRKGVKWSERMLFLTALGIMLVAGLSLRLANAAKHNKTSIAALAVMFFAFSCIFFIIGNGVFIFAGAFTLVGYNGLLLMAPVAFIHTSREAAVLAGLFTSFVLLVDDESQNWNQKGHVLLVFSIVSAILYYYCAYSLSGSKGWDVGGALLLFVGVLTLVNAPFDWLSIGLTRALLRRGVEVGGFAPIWLALLDLVIATLLIVVLAAAMVFAVDLFEVAGRTKIIDVAGVLDALADPVQRLETKYWWIYATLFSTLIPSLLNVALAALSFMRGIIPFHRRVADRMLIGGNTVGTSWWMAPALGLEVVGAAMAGVLLTYLWIFKAVPLLFQPFEWLIPMLRWVAGLV